MTGTTRSPGAGAARGRPRDEELTYRLKDGVLVLLAGEHAGRVTVDALARSTGAGKGGIYRRWDSVLDIAAEAIRERRLVPSVPDTGSLAGDLIALLRPLTGPLTRDERAAAVLAGDAFHHPGVRSALAEALINPLTHATATLLEREASRGRPVSDSSRALLTRMVTALWWNRYISAAPPQGPRDIRDWVELALVPAAGHD